MSTSILRICFPTKIKFINISWSQFIVCLLLALHFSKTQGYLFFFIFQSHFFLPFFYIMLVAKDLLIPLEYFNVLQILIICIVCLPIIVFVLLIFVTSFDF